MEYLSLIGLIFVIHLLAVMSPGPDFVMVLKNAMQYDRKTGVYTAFGISLGIGVHILYSIAGVAYMMQHNVFVFKMVKIAGALYIIYIGMQTINENQPKIEMEKQAHPKVPDVWQAVKTGFLTNVLNPKASLFFLSIFSLVIPPDVPTQVLLVISFMLIAVTFLWFVFVSFVFTGRAMRKIYEKYENLVIKIFGLLLMGLGAVIIFEL